VNSKFSVVSPDRFNEQVRSDVKRALDEDIGDGDLTADILPSDLEAAATVITREHTILCGSAWFEQAFIALDPSARVTWFAAEGAKLSPDDKACRIHGKARALLSAERTALNFLQLLSGVASSTARFVDAVRGTQARIVDTRKTLPGLRFSQKHAVRTGGGTSHRFGLFDAILFKENHIAAAGGIQQAMERSRIHAGRAEFVQIEVETLAELEQALAAGAKMILLDNMSLSEIKQAVAITAGKAELEASGGVSLTTVRTIADTGVDRISVGGITKQVTPADFSMRFD
jgi:nicotinate-nucleotide pyrophosphorylase (carboxylating)